MNPLIPDRERMAYHEAGHAVVGTLGGRKVKSITIDCYRITGRGIVRLGETRYYRAVYERLLDYQNEIQTKLGGALAEKKQFGGISLQSCNGDFNDAVRTHREFTKIWRAMKLNDLPTLQDAWETAERILDHNWYLVEPLAKGLLEKNWLPGRSVRKILHSAVKNRCAEKAEARVFHSADESEGQVGSGQ